MARRRLDDYPWQQDLVYGDWTLRIDESHAFVVFLGYKALGTEPVYGYTVVDALGRQGDVFYDCCENCAKWKCIGFLERNEWRKLAP